MKVEFLPEPELEFGSGQRHVDIRFGLKSFGPVTVDDPTAPSEIRIGLVGPSTAIEGVKCWLERCRNGIAAKQSRKPNLFPEFPSFGPESCFRCDWVLSPSVEGVISNREIEMIVSKDPRSMGVPKLADLFLGECQRLCDKGKVDVLICAPPQALFDYTDAISGTIDDDDSSTDAIEHGVVADFHDILKAKAMLLATPVQVIRPATYDEATAQTTKKGTVRRLQDPATRAWNFHTALYYKAGGTPWRLIRSSSDLDACFVGIGFFRSIDRQTVHTSVAQVFNERGEGMILKGGDATMSDLDNQPHLSKEDIRSLLLKVLQDFRAEHKHLPARIVVHKTSNFDSNELNGCHEALDTLDVSSCDLLTVRSSSIRLFRKGQYPPLRGTFLELDAQHSVLYSRGSIDFYQLYPGMYVPRSLAIVRYDAEQSPHQLASEILALTKMNWNNTQFDSAFPITIKAARQVGRILKYASSVQQIQRGYAFYM